MIRITRDEVVVSDTADVSRLREAFDRQQCVVLPGLIDRPVLDRILQKLEDSVFEPNAYVDEGTGKQYAGEMTPDNRSPASASFYLLLNRPQLFRVIQEIAGCPPIGSIHGRLYRMMSDPDHYMSWHSDSGKHRLIGVSINLSEAEYSGGRFQIRDRNSGAMLHEVVNKGLGDALIFRIAPHLEHRVTRVEGRVSKTAFAGWFRSEPDYRSYLKRVFVASQAK